MRSSTHSFATIACVFCCVVAGLASQAGATVLISQAATAFSGTAPQGTPPWLSLTWNDHGGSGLVTVTLTATNLTGSEFVTSVYMNLDPALDPDDLDFSAPTKVGSFNNPSIHTETDEYKADGDGKYDIKLVFSTSAGTSKRFDAGDAVSYDISGIASLNTYSFDFLSKPAGGSGPFTAAAHVQGINPCAGSYQVYCCDKSGWVAFDPPIIPEPATMALLALGALGLLRRR